MIRFNSDYTEGCHPAILRRLEETNMEQTAGYGEDEYCREAAERIKAVCEAPDANVHFLVGGNTDQCHSDRICIKTLSGSHHGDDRTYQCARDRST